LFTTSFSLSLIEGCLALGRLTEGMALVEAAIGGVETNGDFCYMPELLRVKAQFLRRLPQAPEAAAAACLADALALSRRQGALAWELRASIDLARQLAAEGRPEQARALLHPVFAQFADGADTADLRTAKSLLEGWGEGASERASTR
jgi:predicted ATPase